MKSAIAVLVVLAPIVAASCVPVDTRPNFVVILLDDLDETTSPYWDLLPETKRLIADRGLRFTNAFATDPICCPARASLLTGSYPHNTGVFDITPPDGGFPPFVDNENNTVATRLQAAGYKTAMLGKYLSGVPRLRVPAGWNEWFGFNGGAYYSGYNYTVNHNGTEEAFGESEADYQTDVLANHALEFVDSSEATDNQPFFLFLAPTAPHLSIPPAPRHSGAAIPPLPPRPNYAEVDRSDKSTWLRDATPIDVPILDALVQHDYANRMGSLLAVDEMVASLVSRLEATGELDRTVLIFLSDNGYNQGSHGLVSKQAPYDESIRFRWPSPAPACATGSTIISSHTSTSHRRYWTWPGWPPVTSTVGP